MSLVITSNTPKNDIGTLTDGINQSFSYTNHLQGTLEIKTDSQIAVQSVKINKTGNVMLNESNTKFGIYYGRPENEWTEVSTDAPFETVDIYNNSLMIPAFIVGPDDRNRNFSLGTDLIAEQIQKSFKKVLNCPNLCQTEGIVGVENPGPQITVKRNAAGQGFTGFKFDIQETLSASCTKISDTWVNFNETAEDTAPTFDGTTITNPVGNDRICVVGTGFPLSLNGGKFNCSLGTHKVVSTYPVEFSIGLSRCNGTDEEGSTTSGYEQEPNYWQNTGTGNIFYDWRVANEINAAGKGEVRVYMSAFDNILNTFCEVEFEYYNNKAGPRTGVPLLWEDGNTDAVEFVVRNEQMTINLMEDGDVEATLCTGAVIPGDQSDQRSKPVGPTTRWLFPKLILAAGKNFGINSFSGVPVKDFVYGKCNHFDWYNQRNCDDDIEECELLDKQLIYTYQADDSLTVSPLFYSQKGITAGGFIDYSIRLVSAPRTRYYLGKIGLNSQFILGFQRNGNAPPITGDLGTLQNKIFESSSVPDLVSKQSIFIRLKNLPITSANFSKSAMSNILYHVPTFSNSGEETGSLHFEPNEMVYLDLNNTEPIYISTMEVDLVYGDETLATGLAGKSVVVFHIRDKK